MTFSFKVLSSGTSSTRCTLLELQSSNKTTTILADPGWDGCDSLSFVQEAVTSVDMILLSHTTIDYLGGFIALLVKYPILTKVPVISTLPIANLGKVSTIELYSQLGLIGPTEGCICEVSDVEEYFNKITTLKHSQSTHMAEFGVGLTPFNAGHSLGGVFWKIVNLSNSTDEKHIYAPSWNHAKDSFLNSANFLNLSTGVVNPQLVRPTTMITSNALGSRMGHKKRLEKFFMLVDATLARGGSVVLPTSISGRFLELIHLIDNHLTNTPIPVVLLSQTGTKSLSLSGSMLEYMSPQVIKTWESQSTVPFDASKVQLVSANELMNMPGPKIVFATDADFGIHSLSQQVMMALCNDERTTVMLTEKPHPNTLADQIYKYWEELCRTRNGGVVEDGVAVPLEKLFEVPSLNEEPLMGLELDVFVKRIEGRRNEKKRARAQDMKRLKLMKNPASAEDADEEEEEEEVDEADEDASDSETENANILTDIKGDITTEPTKTQTPYDIPLDFDMRTSKALRNKMFPFQTAKRWRPTDKPVKMDEYGVVLDTEHYKIDNNEPRDVRKPNGNASEARKRRDQEKRFDEHTQQENARLLKLDPLANPAKRLVPCAQKIGVRCGLSFVDLQGLVDLRSIVLIVNLIKPKKVIVFDRSCDLPALQSLAENLVPKGKLENNVLVALPNQQVVVEDMLTNVDIVIDDSLNSMLEWQSLNDGYNVAHVTGHLVTHINQANTKELILKPLQNVQQLQQSQQLTIGDLKLSALRAKLKDLNYKAEFKGEGLLVVNNQLVISKSTNIEGELLLDGTVSEDYYAIREIIKGEFAYV